MSDAIARHWPEYLMEAAGLGLFMISATLFTFLLEHPGSAIHAALPDPSARRLLMGVLMGLTAITLIYSPWGKRSGAHFNPSVTFTFYRLGKIERWDALFYVASQFAGGIAGVVAARAIAGAALGHTAVRYAATTPGRWGRTAAFAGELAISFLLMLAVLVVSNRRAVARYTGLVAGVLIALYIGVEAPVSGMSMNPARTFASALPSGIYSALWIYFSAPLIGMLLAAWLYTSTRGGRAVACAKLHHDNPARCIFRCRY